MMLTSFILFSILLGAEAAFPETKTILEQLRRTGACCTAINYFLPGKVHFNNITDLEYQASLKSYWSAQEQSLSPACIVVPTATQDVSIAVAVLSAGYQASISRCNFAIRGAGHTPQAGAANIDGGVTIDMQSMNQVAISPDQKIVSIGSGNRWGNIYPSLDDRNLAMVGGRVSPVGTGGLLTGGGISFFSGRYGFACDNIETFEIVLANGTVTTASRTRNSDLFRALKGGSSNFGVVTRFDARIYDQMPFWGGSVSQPITNKELIFDFITKFTVSANYDPYSALLSNFAWVAGIPEVIHQPVYTNGNATWPPPAFEPLDSMPKLTSTVRKDKLSSFTNELATTSSPTNGRNNLFLTSTFLNKEATAEFMADIYDLADAVATELVTVVGLIFTMTFQPLPYVLYSKSAVTGGNVLGLDRFRDDLINLLFTVSWQLPLDSARVEERLKVLESDINNLAKSRGLFNEFIYLNYASAWQDPFQGYGDANVQFMRGVSRKYDPNGVFQRAVPGGFKLGM